MKFRGDWEYLEYDWEITTKVYAEQYEIDIFFYGNRNSFNGWTIWWEDIGEYDWWNSKFHCQLSSRLNYITLWSYKYFLKHFFQLFTDQYKDKCNLYLQTKNESLNLMKQMSIYYGKSSTDKYNAVRVFNHLPEKFNHLDLIENYKFMKEDLEEYYTWLSFVIKIKHK